MSGSRLGIGLSLPKANTPKPFGLTMAQVLEADGGTILSIDCLNILGRQIDDVTRTYYKWDVAIDVLTTDGGTEIDRACGMILAKQIF